MQVILMRGLPGSGKSTYAREKCPHHSLPNWEAVVCSADHSHMKDGVYQFDPANVKRAHDLCFHFYHETLRNSEGGTDFLVVDNTNLHVWELAPYYRLAEMLCEFSDEVHSVKIVRCHCSFETALKRNTHNVPSDKLWGMYQTLLGERLPPWWKEEIVVTEEGR